MTKANRSKVVRRRTRRRGTTRRGGAGAAASASRRSHGSSHCEWRVTSSSVDREDGDIEDFGHNHPHPTVHFNDIAGKNGHPAVIKMLLDHFGVHINNAIRSLAEENCMGSIF